MAVQFLVPAADMAGVFTSSVLPNVWFGNGSSGQITSNLFTYIRENSGSGNNTASYMDGNVLLTGTNVTPTSGTAVYVTHLSSGSAPAGNAIATYYQTFYNDTAPAASWSIELRQHYVSELNQGTLIASYDATLQTSGNASPAPTSGTISASFFPPGGTDYTDLSIRIIEGVLSGSRTWIGWIKLEIDSIPPQSKVWLGQAPISGAFTGAFQGDGSQLTNVTSSIGVSASYAGTSSFTSDFRISGSAFQTGGLGTGIRARSFLVSDDFDWADSFTNHFNTGGMWASIGPSAAGLVVKGLNPGSSGLYSLVLADPLANILLGNPSGTLNLALTPSSGTVTVGPDPGGSNTLRVSGTFNVGGTNLITSSTGSISHKAFGEFVPEVTWSSVTASGVKPNGTIWIQY